MACCLSCANYDTDLFHWKKSKCTVNVNGGEGCQRIFFREDGEQIRPSNCPVIGDACSCQFYIQELKKKQSTYIVDVIEI